MLKGAPERVLTVVLLAQAAAFYAVASRTDFVPAVAPLTEFGSSVNGWVAVRDFPLEKEVQDVLRADDTLNRVYVRADEPAQANLFIAFFKTQRQGQAPHSPKNCLPGSGWQPTDDSKLPIAVPGRDQPIVVNKYVVSRGEEQSLVLYWYQSHNRVIAGEFAAKIRLVADAIQSRRSDTALVRMIVPVRGGDTAAAQRTAVKFVEAMYPEILRRLPA